MLSLVEFEPLEQLTDQTNINELQEEHHGILILKNCLYSLSSFVDCSEMEGTARPVQGKTVKFTNGRFDDFRSPPLPPLKTPPITTVGPFPKEPTSVTTDDARSSPVTKMASGDKPRSVVGRKHTPELPSINKPGSGKSGSGRSRPSTTASRQVDPSVVLTYLKKNTYDDLGKLLYHLQKQWVLWTKNIVFYYIYIYMH